MSNKKLFWIVFFGLTLVEIGQLAYSHDKAETAGLNNQMLTGQCYASVNSELTGQHNSVYGQPRLMLI